MTDKVVRVLTSRDINTDQMSIINGKLFPRVINNGTTLSFSGVTFEKRISDVINITQVTSNAPLSMLYHAFYTFEIPTDKRLFSPMITVLPEAGYDHIPVYCTIERMTDTQVKLSIFASNRTSIKIQLVGIYV